MPLGGSDRWGKFPLEPLLAAVLAPLFGDGDEGDGNKVPLAPLASFFFRLAPKQPWFSPAGQSSKRINYNDQRRSAPQGGRQNWNRCPVFQILFNEIARERERKTNQSVEPWLWFALRYLPLPNWAAACRNWDWPPPRNGRKGCGGRRWHSPHSCCPCGSGRWRLGRDTVAPPPRHPSAGVPDGLRFPQSWHSWEAMRETIRSVAVVARENSTNS